MREEAGADDLETEQDQTENQELDRDGLESLNPSFEYCPGGYGCDCLCSSDCG